MELLTRPSFARWFCLAIAMLLSACSSVPPQSVQLSQAIGSDLAALQVSYEQLIDAHFDHLKSRRIAYLEDEWAPAYLRQWVADGRLRRVAAGEVVFNQSTGRFESPTSGREEQQLLDTVFSWADAAIFEIETKRTELLAPLEADRQALLAEVRLAFANLQAANANVTALLQSLVEVNTAQQQALDQLGAGQLTQEIQRALVSASDRADQALQAIREQDGI